MSQTDLDHMEQLAVIMGSATKEKLEKVVLSIVSRILIFSTAVITGLLVFAFFIKPVSTPPVEKIIQKPIIEKIIQKQTAQQIFRDYKMYDKQSKHRVCSYYRRHNQKSTEYYTICKPI